MKKLSQKKAIKEKCIECIYDPHGGGGTWLQQVSNCTSYSCPLFELRPLTADLRAKRDEKHLASLSDEERVIVENRRRKAAERMAEMRASHEI